MYQNHETKHDLVDELVPKMAFIIANVSPKNWPSEFVIAMGAGLYSLKKRELIELKKEMIQILGPLKELEEKWERRQKK